jgi:hypothetical protein
MSVMPLYAFVQGDTMGIVVLARLDGTVKDLADNLLRATGVRVKRRGSFQLLFGTQSLDLAATLAIQGMQLLDRVDLVWDPETQ